MFYSIHSNPKRLLRPYASIWGALILVSAAAQAANVARAPGLHTVTSIGPEDLAVIVNDADPVSVKIAAYYQSRRRIPERNMIHVRFDPHKPSLPRPEFERVKNIVNMATPARVQAYALAWTIPYRVACMSITTAFALGFDQAFCSRACAPTKPSPYFNSTSRRPYEDYGIRPTMALAGKNIKEVQRLIDRGVAADASFPRATGYLVSTSDKSRNVRAATYTDIIQQYWQSNLDLRIVKADFIRNRERVLFYFTGIKQVNFLDTIKFLPGAIADHLTSAGGNLTSNGDQMSSLRWLEAGATGSYGAVVEPCNFPAKFPQPAIVLNRYMNGETLIEAYWKSVAWPGEGIFIGEPLAAPYAQRRPGPRHARQQ